MYHLSKPGLVTSWAGLVTRRGAGVGACAQSRWVTTSEGMLAFTGDIRFHSHHPELSWHGQHAHQTSHTPHWPDAPAGLLTRRPDY